MPTARSRGPSGGVRRAWTELTDLARQPEDDPERREPDPRVVPEVDQPGTTASAPAAPTEAPGLPPEVWVLVAAASDRYSSPVPGRSGLVGVGDTGPADT